MVFFTSPCATVVASLMSFKYTLNFANGFSFSSNNLSFSFGSSISSNGSLGQYSYSIMTVSVSASSSVLKHCKVNGTLFIFTQISEFK